MDVLRINYYDDFKCIANKCKDTCCSGWAVNIDESSYETYSKDKYYDNSMVEIDNKNYFILDKESGDCGFLENNLCKIVRDKGSKQLCITCKRYPRAISIYNNIVFETLHFSCEAVMPLILKNKKELNFDIFSIKDRETGFKPEDIEKNGFTQETNFEVFKLCLSVLQHPTHKLYEKLTYIFMALGELDEIDKNLDTNLKDEKVDLILAQYFENLDNDEIFDIIKNVQTEAPKLKLDFYNLLYKLFPEFQMIKTSDKNLKNKFENVKPLAENSDEEIINYLDKISNYLNKNEKMLERYLICLLVENKFPTSFDDFEKAMKYILFRIAMIEYVMMILNINSSEEVDDDIFFEAIRIFSRNQEHSDSKRNSVKEFVSTSDFNFKIYINCIL